MNWTIGNEKGNEVKGDNDYNSQSLTLAPSNKKSSYKASATKEK